MQTLRGNLVDFHVHFTLQHKRIIAFLSNVYQQAVIHASMSTDTRNRDTDLHFHADPS